MRILSFGHIPTWAGGKQESGLANVIYQLAKHGSDIEDEEVFLAATDSFVPRHQDGRLTILGWTKVGLLSYVLLHPWRTVRSFFVLRNLKKKYPKRESVGGLFLKRIFFDKSIHEVCPDLVHLHGIQTVWYQDLVPAGCKLVVTFHGIIGLDIHLPEREVNYQMERDSFLSNRVDEVFFICTQLVSLFIEAYGNNGKKNQVIFNSYDNAHFYLDASKVSRASVRVSHKHNITLYTIASLSDLKGQKRVLEAISSVGSDNNRFVYRCVGGDSVGLSHELELFALKHSIDFKYLGKKSPDEIRELLSGADYMIMPSSSEGFGLTYLEAIACGVPVILPKNLPISQEKELINERNSILLDDCSSMSIAKVLLCIEEFRFERVEVASSISSLSWNEVAKQYINAFRII